MAPGPRPRKDHEEYTEMQICPKCGQECKRLSSHDHQSHSPKATFDPHDGTGPVDVIRQLDGNFKCPYCAQKLKTVVNLQSHYKHCPFIDLSSTPVPQMTPDARPNRKSSTAVASAPKPPKSRFPGQPNVKRPAPPDAESQREAKRARKDTQTATRGGHFQSPGRHERPPQSSSRNGRSSIIPKERPPRSASQQTRIVPPIRSAAPSPPLRPKEETIVSPSPTKQSLPVANSGLGLTVDPTSPTKSHQAYGGRASETSSVVPNLEPRHSPGRDPRRAKADRPIRALPNHPPSQRQAILANKPPPPPTISHPTAVLPPRPNVKARSPSPPNAAAASQSIASTAVVSEPMYPTPTSAPPLQNAVPVSQPVVISHPIPPSRPNPYSSIPQSILSPQPNFPAAQDVSSTPQPPLPLPQLNAPRPQRTPQPIITAPRPISPVSQPVSPVIQFVPAQPPARQIIAEDDVLTPPPTPSFSERKLRAGDTKPRISRPSVYTFLQRLEPPLGAHIGVFDGLGIQSYEDLVNLRKMGDQCQDRLQKRLEDSGLSFMDSLLFLDGLKSLK